jgi:hypothetical protein
MMDILRDLRAATPDNQTHRKCTSPSAIHFSLEWLTPGPSPKSHITPRKMHP